MYIGYNIPKINGLLENVANAHVLAVKRIETLFNESLKPVLREHWVGEDELAFEKALIGRLNNLLGKIDGMALRAVETIRENAVEWIRFQNTNSYATTNLGPVVNASDGNALMERIVVPTIERGHQIVFETKIFSGSEDFGLSYDTSKDSCLNQLRWFVQEIKKSMQQLFDQVNVDNAFYGTEQSSALKQLLRNVGESFGIVATCIKDFEDAMGGMIGEYTVNDLEVGISFSGDSNMMEKEADEHQSRWE